MKLLNPIEKRHHLPPIKKKTLPKKTKLNKVKSKPKQPTESFAMKLNFQMKPTSIYSQISLYPEIMNYLNTFHYIQ